MLIWSENVNFIGKGFFYNTGWICGDMEASEKAKVKLNIVTCFAIVSLL